MRPNAAADDSPILPRRATGTLVAAVAPGFVAQIGVSIPATTQGLDAGVHIETGPHKHAIQQTFFCTSGSRAATASRSATRGPA